MNYESAPKSPKSPLDVIPAKAGIQSKHILLDPGFRFTAASLAAQVTIFGLFGADSFIILMLIGCNSAKGQSQDKSKEINKKDVSEMLVLSVIRSMIKGKKIVEHMLRIDPEWAGGHPYFLMRTQYARLPGFLGGDLKKAGEYYLK